MLNLKPNIEKADKHFITTLCLNDNLHCLYIHSVLSIYTDTR